MKKGLSLIESVVVIMLAAIIASVVALYIRESLTAWDFMSGQKNITSSSRAAGLRLVRELKRIKNNAGLSVQASTEVEFTDIDDKTINFRQDGTRLMRNQDVLSDKLSSPGGLLLTYLDKAGAATSDQKQVKTIRVRITAINGQNKFVMESAARLRNTD
ncbi:MAG: prepilin-type N-terminal cleavage/methylation domain-containing protein [Candidatus Margulisbacteria bacterium]|nr:prepilin-type N-terminal cleavage/methylation domain-containing protein [Candidatus Margulisiibacteriota bacterium]